MKRIDLTKRLVFFFDISDIYFPIAFRRVGVGNDNRTWTVGIYFLCFQLIYCVDEDSY